MGTLSSTPPPPEGDCAGCTRHWGVRCRLLGTPRPPTRLSEGRRARSLRARVLGSWPLDSPTPERHVSHALLSIYRAVLAWGGRAACAACGRSWHEAAARGDHQMPPERGWGGVVQLHLACVSLCVGTFYAQAGPTHLGVRRAQAATTPLFKKRQGLLTWTFACNLASLRLGSVQT